MDIQTVLVYLIFGCCIIYVIRATVKKVHKKTGSGCGCGCTGCDMAKNNEKKSGCCSSDHKSCN